MAIVIVASASGLVVFGRCPLRISRSTLCLSAFRLSCRTRLRAVRTLWDASDPLDAALATRHPRGFPDWVNHHAESSRSCCAACRADGASAIRCEADLGSGFVYLSTHSRKRASLSPNRGIQAGSRDSHRLCQVGYARRFVACSPKLQERIVQSFAAIKRQWPPRALSNRVSCLFHSG